MSHAGCQIVLYYSSLTVTAEISIRKITGKHDETGLMYVSESHLKHDIYWYQLSSTITADIVCFASDYTKQLKCCSPQKVPKFIPFMTNLESLSDFT